MDMNEIEFDCKRKEEQEIKSNRKKVRLVILITGFLILLGGAINNDWIGGMGGGAFFVGTLYIASLFLSWLLGEAVSVFD